MTPEERAERCQPTKAYTDEIDHECVKAIAATIREAVAEATMNIDPIHGLIVESRRMLDEFTTKYGKFAPVKDPGSAAIPSEQATVPDEEVYVGLKAAIKEAEKWVEAHYDNEVVTAKGVGDGV